MYDIVALGELLIDFTDVGFSPDGRRLYEQNPGGAPCNMLCIASNCGMKTSFIGKVGCDIHGNFLRSTLNKYHIGTDGLIVDPSVYTTLAFVTIEKDGERNFSFARSPGADSLLRKNELNTNLLKNCRLFHFGSVSLSQEPCRSATFEAIRIAQQSGAIISYDPNYRQPLWNKAEDSAAYLRCPLPHVDIMKLSEEEINILTGYHNLADSVESLHKKGVICVAVTLGKDGSLISLKNKGTVHINAVNINKVIDATGAGDAYWGAFISCFLSSKKELINLSLQDAEEFGTFAGAAAALCIQKRGGIPAMPSLKDILSKVDEFKMKRGKVEC